MKPREKVKIVGVGSWGEGGGWAGEIEVEGMGGDTEWKLWHWWGGGDSIGGVGGWGGGERVGW